MSRAEAGPDRHSFWHDPALPFIEARAVQDGRHVCYDKHSHAHFSIGAITGGHSHYLNQRSLQEVGPGSLVLMNPEEVHACNPIADQPWSYLMFYLDTDWLRSQQEEAGLGGEFRPFDMTASRDPLLYQGLQHLHHQLVQAPDPLAREVACHLFSRQLLARLTPARWDDRPPQHLQRAAELMQDDSASPLSLSQLSTVAGLTPSHFVRAFSQHYGMTPTPICWTGASATPAPCSNRGSPWPRSPWPAALRIRPTSSASSNAGSPPPRASTGPSSPVRPNAPDRRR